MGNKFEYDHPVKSGCSCRVILSVGKQSTVTQVFE